MENNKIDRRDFLKTGAKTIALGTLALSSFDVLKLIASAKDTETSNGSVDKVIKLSDYPSLSNTGGYEMITSKVIVIRKSSSKFIALSTVCTHKKCDVEYDGSSFECPCHGSTFDGSGKVTGGPAQKSLKTFKTTYDASENTLTINI